jgi:CDP-glucose 4,6-dehydratase
VRAVLNVTSDKCYDNKEWVWGYRENDRLGGYDPYSNSKACAELVTAAYRNSYFNPAHYAEHGVALASARAGNVVGGGDWAHDRLIPDVLRAIERGEPVSIRNPDAIRPWQHVLEPLSGYLQLARKLCLEGIAYADGWNFGPHEGDVKPVAWIVDRIATAWGPGASWKLDGAQHPHEAHYLKLDCSKARAELGWKPRWNIEQTIDRIVEWHKAREAGADMRRLTLQQIDHYSHP